MGGFPLRGRDKLLGQLLAKSRDLGVRVVHGMGGCGKTGLALKAAHLASRRDVEVSSVGRRAEDPSGRAGTGPAGWSDR